MKTRASSGPHRVLLAAAAILAFLAVLPAGADTVLVATRETVDGAPAALPLPLEEGLFAALFAAGHIVFGQDGREDPGAVPLLLSVALAGGARHVLEAAVDWSVSASRAGPATVTGQVRWTLWRAADGAAAATGTVAAGNEGREKTVDLAALGGEAGLAVVQAVQALLGGRN